MLLFSAEPGRGPRGPHLHPQEEARGLQGDGGQSQRPEADHLQGDERHQAGEPRQERELRDAGAGPGDDRLPAPPLLQLLRVHAPHQRQPAGPGRGPRPGVGRAGPVCCDIVSVSSEHKFCSCPTNI